MIFGSTLFLFLFTCLFFRISCCLLKIRMTSRPKVLHLPEELLALALSLLHSREVGQVGRCGSEWVARLVGEELSSRAKPWVFTVRGAGDRHVWSCDFSPSGGVQGFLSLFPLAYSPSPLPLRLYPIYQNESQWPLPLRLFAWVLGVCGTCFFLFFIGYHIAFAFGRAVMVYNIVNGTVLLHPPCLPPPF